MSEYKYLQRDQNWQDETTVYWFRAADSETIGVRDCNGSLDAVDADGCPINLGDAKNAALRNWIGSLDSAQLGQLPEYGNLSRWRTGE